MKHPYHILIENISKYSKTLNKDDVTQYAENAFQINDIEFNKLSFFNDVTKETGIKPKEHEYIGAACADPKTCFKPYTVFGFDNVLFYFKNDDFD